MLHLIWPIVVDLHPEFFDMFQVTFTLTVKVWKTENVALHGDIQGRWAGYSWSPFLGCVMIDKSGLVDRGTLGKGDEECTPYMDINAIVHTHTSRTVAIMTIQSSM